jgi:serine/threonine protein kinase
VNSNVQPLKASDPTSFGGWKILGRLGEGGYSTIFLGEKKKQLAALKMIRKDMMSDVKVYERFVTEINNLEKLDHPGIAKFIECDLSTNVPFIAVEYVEGKTLEQRVVDEGPLDEAEWLDFLGSVAAALEYCHKNKITHKDVSPRNIVLSIDGPKLIDFGISYRVDDPRITQGDETVGTPGYMSPEHWAGQAANTMDIFSLGSTFAYAGTGYPAFGGESKSQIQISTSYKAPQLERLSKIQKALVIPMLYKRSDNRASLEAIIDAVNSAKVDNRSTLLSSYHKGSDEKLVETLHPSGKKPRPIKLIAIISLIAAVAASSSILLISSARETPKDSASYSALSPQIARLNQEAELLIAQKDYKAAYEVAFESASKGNAQGMLLAGNSLESMQETEKALAWYKKSCQIDYSEGCFDLGNLLIETDRDSEGLIYLDKAAKLGDVRAMTNLGVYYREIGNKEFAISYFKEAADLNELSALNALGEIYEEEGKISESLKWYTLASDGGYVPGSMHAGFIYKSSKSYELAKKYFKIAIAQGEPLGNWALGEVYLSQKNISEAEKYFLIGANLKEVFSGNALASLYFNELKSEVKACLWAKRTSEFKDIDKDNLTLARKNIAMYCKGSTTVTPSKSASPKVSATPSSTPNLSSEKFTVSPPLAANVATTSIFGRIFLDGLNYWRVILTNSKSEVVPPITGVQFRLIGYPDAGWMGVPYKLKVEPSNGSVYAEVDDMMFSILFKNNPYCPEFRAVREENGKIVKIWEKTKPECATDYTP